MLFQTMVDNHFVLVLWRANAIHYHTTASPIRNHVVQHVAYHRIVDGNGRAQMIVLRLMMIISNAYVIDQSM